MKQSFKVIAATFLLSLGINTLSFAQDMVAVHPVKTTTIISSDEENNPGENVVISNFSSLFPNASQPKWAVSGGNNFVSFLNAGRKATASFTSKGSLNYVLTSCGTENLPSGFNKSIKKYYAGYQLFNATEIKAYGETAYQAVLENATTFVTLKYTTDGMEEIQQVKK